MRIIRVLIKSSLPLFLIACISSVLTGLSSTLIIKSIHGAVKGDAIDQSFFTNFFIYWIGYGIFSLLAAFTVIKLTQQIIHKLRMDFSQKILEAPFITIEHNQSRLLPVLTEDIRIITNSINRLPTVTTGLASVIGIMAYLIWYSPALTLSLTLVFVVVFIITKISLPFVKKYADKARHQINDLYQTFEGLVYGIKELSLNEDFKKSYIKKQIEPSSLKQNNYFLKENISSTLANRMTDMTMLLGVAMIILVIYKTQFVTLTFFGEYLTLVLFILTPLSTATGFLANIKRIEVSLDHVEKIGIMIDAEEQKRETIHNPNWKNTQPLIELRKIKHGYYHSEEDESFTLGPIDLQIQQGKTIFIAGGNGSGKTTLAKLILGLYQSNEGEIIYRGVPITENNIQFYQSRFSAIFTDSYVFDQLLHIDKNKLQEEGELLIEMLELSKKVTIENQKFTTKRLSDGQKKRLALIISILEDKECYLFDEWAANQDPHFKEVFYTKILTYLKKKGKTILVITHDDRYFDLADQLLKLRDGQLSSFTNQ